MKNQIDLKKYVLNFVKTIFSVYEKQFLFLYACVEILIRYRFARLYRKTNGFVHGNFQLESRQYESFVDKLSISKRMFDRLHVEIQ